MSEKSNPTSASPDSASLDSSFATGMKAKLLSSKKLKRVLSISAPLEKVQGAYDDVYQRLKKNMRVPGFRVGHFPKEMAEKRFSEVMSREVLENLAPKYFRAAVEQLKLSPATSPVFSKLNVDIQAPLSFEVEFEIVPEFKLYPYNKFKLKKQVAIPVQEAEIEAQLNKIRKEKAQTKSKDGVASQGDLVVFDFKGLLNGEAFAGGEGDNQSLEVGGANYLPDFQSQFEGVSKGQQKTFSLTFPADYPSSEMAGKQVEFTIKIKDVQQIVLPEVNQAFWQSFGEFKDKAAFVEQVIKTIEIRKKHEQHRQNINSLAEQIQEKYNFDVPEKLLKEGLSRLEARMNKQEATNKNMKKILAEEEKKLRDGLRLNYVVDAIVRTYGVKVDAAELRQRFNMQALILKKDPNELISSPLGENMLQEIHSNILYEQSLSYLVALALGEIKPGSTPNSEPSTPPA